MRATGIQVSGKTLTIKKPLTVISTYSQKGGLAQCKPPIYNKQQKKTSKQAPRDRGKVGTEGHRGFF